MNETRQGNDDGRSLAPVIGFAAGALVGGVLALLLAPASGEQTRQRLGNAARRLSHDARHTLEEARGTVSKAASGLGTDVKAAVEAGREAFRHDGEPHEPRSASQIAQLTDPPPTQTP
jgi:gas vesicle protein